LTLLVVGFDLDLTLIDSRAGIAATYRELAARTGVAIDADLVVTRLGPPLAHEMANWFPPDLVAEAVEIYRSLYPAYAIDAAPPMPGAVAALSAVHAAGGRVAVVTAKTGTHARLHLDHLGLAVDDLTGDLWAAEKGIRLRELGASIYVGDHVADMAAAHVAGATAVGVASGPCDPDELAAAGADVVLPDLHAFPGWLRSRG
jgi:phosphoglycolate phosphatase